jgi:hypothetical protein
MEGVAVLDGGSFLACLLNPYSIGKDQPDVQAPELLDKRHHVGLEPDQADGDLNPPLPSMLGVHFRQGSLQVSLVRRTPLFSGGALP